MSSLRGLHGGRHLNDHWDFDHPFERLPVDTSVPPRSRRRELDIPGARGRRDTEGRDRHSRQDRRRVHTRPRDRRVPLGHPTAPQNVVTDIDGTTGAITPTGGIVFTAEGQEMLACPSWFRAKDWESVARFKGSSQRYSRIKRR